MCDVMSYAGSPATPRVSGGVKVLSEVVVNSIPL